ncbi:PadR family transcriptional regulator [Rossellomorea vietnamensis]|uniref:PadR family transcriptional regulator n=1 Tax=Rossellomorea vietnamensis TaxID=218284 RepID=A0A5D4MIA7_9BACI|nr:PadR family transcriptional regulator [Rossellomorea vietnamensis]TYS01298.1 PadR family transcriptional regulator [Rossellomorea vietnamensis]
MYRLIILGLMNEKPRHGYEIQQILQSSHIDLWTNIQTNSIYHAFRQMAKEELIEKLGTETAGNRVRVVYKITENGRKEFADLLKEAIGKPTLNFPSNLYAGLSFLEDLPPTTCIDLINEHIQSLEEKIMDWEQGKNSSKFADSPDLKASLYELTLQNGIQHIKLDIEYLNSIKTVLEERKG